MLADRKWVFVWAACLLPAQAVFILYSRRHDDVFLDEGYRLGPARDGGIAVSACTLFPCQVGLSAGSGVRAGCGLDRNELGADLGAMCAARAHCTLTVEGRARGLTDFRVLYTRTD
jgi:hypothetical protein